MSQSIPKNSTNQTTLRLRTALKLLAEAAVTVVFFVGLYVIAGSTFAAEPGGAKGDRLMYRFFCKSHEAITQAATVHGAPSGCFFTNRPWPAVLVEQHQAVTSSDGKHHGVVWKAVDIPPPHEEVWIIVRLRGTSM